MHDDRDRRDRHHQHTSTTSRGALPAPTTASSSRLRGAPDSASPATGRSLPHHLAASANIAADSAGPVASVAIPLASSLLPAPPHLPTGPCMRSRTRSTPRAGIAGHEPSAQR